MTASERHDWRVFFTFAGIFAAFIAGHQIGAAQGYRIGEAAGQRAAEVRGSWVQMPAEVPSPPGIPPEVTDYLSADCEETTVLSSFWAAAQFSQAARKAGPTVRGSAWAELETAERLRILGCLWWWGR